MKKVNRFITVAMSALLVLALMLAWTGSQVAWAGTMTWISTGGPPYGGVGSDVSSLAWNGTDTLYAGCATSVYSKIGAGSWTDTGAIHGGVVRSLAWNGTDTLYAGCGSSVYSKIGAGSWTNTGGPGVSVYCLAWNGTDTLYAGSSNGLVYSKTGAGSWTDTGVAVSGSVMSLAWNGTDTLYAGGSGDGHVHSKTVAGSWTDTGVAGGSIVYSLAWNGAAGLYAGCDDGHVYSYRSGSWTDTGATGGSYVPSLTWNGTDTLYAGSDNGVFSGLVTHSITVTQAAHGTIAPTGTAGVVIVNAGDSQAFTITPDLHYRIADVVVDTTTHLGPVSGYTFTGVTADHTITALFAQITHDITVTQGANGTITLEGTAGKVTVNDGANQSFTITADADYHVADVEVDGVSKGALPSYTFNNVTANHTITATFASDSATWYLAEGTTAWGFDTYISIENPNTSAVHAAITYMTGTGNVSGGNITLPAKSQTTVNPADTLGNKDFSTKVVCTEGKPIAVDRTMSWTGPGAASPEGHSSVGVTSPAKTWYLPEGCSAFGFETWLLIQNPNGGTATASVTYMIEGEAPVTTTKTVPANTRKTFNMADDIGAKNASIKVDSNIPVIPERAMYRNNRREGHDSIGTTTAASDYFLAEGTTAWGFTTWVLIQNPASAPADVTITYMTGTGAKAQPSFTLAGNSRKTIKVNDVAGMEATDFSTAVHGSSPIIAERSMYWDNGTGEACHDSIGMSSSHRTFYLPDGETANGRETWTLVQNPNSSAVTVEVSYLKAGGGVETLTKSIPANSRMTFNMADKVPNGRASIMVTSQSAGKKIMVERAMYWNSRGAGTDTIGGFSD